MWTLDFLAKLRWLPPLAVRAVLGFSFFAMHGMERLRPGGTWDWGEAWVSKNASAGVAPTPVLYVAVIAEFLAGVAIAIGFLTRWAALGILGITLYAVLKLNAGAGYYAQELRIAYLAACVVLMVYGPGSWSVDRVVFGRRVLPA